MSDQEPFRSVFDGLTSMGFYNLNPARIREPLPPDPGVLLQSDGGNLASVLGRLAPGVTGMEPQSVGHLETLRFRQHVEGQQHPWRFAATNVSDGTIRGLGVLVALLQSNEAGPSLVGIEEPEAALHLAALGVLIDAIADAARQSQVVVTTHSTDLLDREDIDDQALLAVVAEHGVTAIGRVDAPMSLHRCA